MDNEKHLVMEYIECPTCKKIMRSAKNEHTVIKERLTKTVLQIREHVLELKQLKNGNKDHDAAIEECQKKLLKDLRMEHLGWE